jgi:outer membrane protein assembly factor BamB
VAKGRAIGRFEAAIGLIGLIALGVTLSITLQWNPWPMINTWLQQTLSVSSPTTPWRVRMVGKPLTASIADGGQTVVVMRDRVEALAPATGVEVWHHDDASWGIVSGNVVVIGNKDEKGYSVVSAGSGVPIWGEPAARAAWVYEGRILDLTCPGPEQCLLRAHDNAGRELWPPVTLPGDGRRLSGLNPSLSGVRPPDDWFEVPTAGRAAKAPDVLGIPFGDRLLVVDAVEGRLLREVAQNDRHNRAIVTGGRLLFAKADRIGSSCHFTVEALDPDSGEPVWQREGLDVGSTSGAGCEQRNDPLGGGEVLSSVDRDNRPVLLRTRDGAQLWKGQLGEQVVATDGELAAILSVDHGKVRIIDLLAGNATVTERDADSPPQVAITQCSLFFLGPPRNQLLVLARDGVTVRATSKLLSTIVGYGDNGVVIAAGRTVGVIPLTPGCAATVPAEPEPGAGVPESPEPQSTGAGKG